MTARDQGHWLRAALLAATALGVPALPAWAQDATWNLNGTGDFNTAANWTPGTVPTGTAFFGVSNQNAVSLAGGVTIGGFTLNAVASNYTFDAFNGLFFTGAGIVINGGSATIDNSGFLTFSNTSNAGSATINNNGGSMAFVDSSTAGSATITNTNLLQFFDASSADSATISNQSGLTFFDTATAGSATIDNLGLMTFLNNATAGGATITNNPTTILHFAQDSTAGGATIINLASGTVRFVDSASAGSATITNDGELTFRVTSTAGSATITNNTGTFRFFDSASAGSATITNNAGTVQFFDNTSAGSAAITNNNLLSFRNNSTAANATITNNNLFQFFDTSTAGSATITNNSGLLFQAGSTAGSATITNNSALQFVGSSTAGSATITNNSGLQFFNSTTAGSATITNFDVVQFIDSSTAGSATITSNSSSLFDGVQFLNSSTAGSATINNNNGTLLFSNDSTAGSATITNNARLTVNNNATAGSATITNNNLMRFLDTASGGTARLINGAAGTIDLSELTSAGIATGSIEGGGAIALGSKNLAVGANNLSTTFSGVIADGGNGGGTGGSFTKEGTGTLTLSGINTYTGATTVNAGTLLVNGSTALSSLTTVNSGATLGGTGTVGTTTINGGTLSPGTSIGTLTVAGSLAFQAAAVYLVEVAATADRTNVTGAATLAGTVHAQFGTSLTNAHTVLSAASGLGGTQFGALTTTNLPAGFTASLSYTGTDVILNLAAQIGSGGGLNQNQQNVANAINNFFNAGGALPAGFVTVSALTGPALGNALTQLSGEHATGVQPASLMSMGLFLNLMLDPFVTGRAGGSGSAMAYAPPPRAQSEAEAAFAAALPVKAPPLAPSVEPRWTVWGSAFGGRNRTDGDPIVVGSNDLTATAAGFAVGADYRVSPDTMIGAATAIGETRWRVHGLGSGRADAAQFGGYASTRWQSLYLSGAVAGAWYRAATDRTVTVAGADRLEADFDATSLGARVEGGRRFGTPQHGLTPYGAVQVQSVHAPSYGERATAGSNQFALTYASQTATDTRSELGLWADTRHLFANGSALVLRGRAAWVHDFNPGARTNAAFQTLPGASFTVDGAAAPRDAALTSAVAEVRFTNGVSLIGKFDGEFSGRSRTVAGTGTVRYAW